MRKLIKIILPVVGVGDLKIRPRGDNRCESAKATPASKYQASAKPTFQPLKESL